MKERRRHACGQLHLVQALPKVNVSQWLIVNREGEYGERHKPGFK